MVTFSIIPPVYGVKTVGFFKPAPRKNRGLYRFPGTTPKKVFRKSLKVYLKKTENFSYVTKKNGLGKGLKLFYQNPFSLPGNSRKGKTYGVLPQVYQKVPKNKTFFNVFLNERVYPKR